MLALALFAAVAASPLDDAGAAAVAGEGDTAASGAAPTFTIESDAKDGRVRVVRIAIVDPADVVVKVAFRGQSGVTSPAVRAAPRLELELPGEGAVELLGLDAGGAEIVRVVLPPLDAPVAVTVAPAPVAAEEGGGPWLVVGGVAAAVVVVGAAVAAGVVWALQPPARAGFKTDVVFGDAD